MKWFQVDSDTPNDPKIRMVLKDLGPEGVGGLFLLWCHIADHGTRKPGWSVDTGGRPMPEAELQDASKLSAATFTRLVDICVEVGHFKKSEWVSRRVIAIPAMVRRADTYTRRRVRTHVEHGSNKVGQSSPTRQHNTRHTNKERTAAPRALALEEARSNTKVIGRLALDVVDRAEDGAGFPDLKADLKRACSKHRIAYDSESAGAALESALARKAKAS